MLSSDPVPDVSELVFEFLERLETRRATPSTVLDELCGAWPSRAESLREAVGRLAGSGLMAPGHDGHAEGEETRIGPYVLGRRLGSGGMGVVHLAWKDGEEAPVALKLLRSDLRSEPDATSRFDREIEVAARLDHPNIVRVVDRGALEDGQRFLAMEYHAGGTLDRAIASCAAADAPPTRGAAQLSASGGDVDPLEVPRTMGGPWWQVAVRVAREVARALAHAHARGVVHRDVKPSNVLVTPRGRVLLLDFGLATLRGSGRLTVTGVQLGSLPYMSPEQVRGETVSDERTDVYSLAVTTYELLTRTLPFRGDTPERLGMAISRGAAKRPSTLADGIPRETAEALDAVLGCAMDVDPRRRYASAEAFAADLTAILDGRPVVARPQTTLVRTVRWMRRRPFVAATAALGMLVLIGGPLAYAALTQRHSAQMEETLDATLGHLSSLIEAIDGGIRTVADGPLRAEPSLVATRLLSTSKALAILEDVERDGARFLQSDDPRAREIADELLRARARLHFTRGDALYDDARPEEAVEEYREHERIFRSFLERDPDHLDTLRDLASCLAQQARARHRRHGYDPAFDVLDESILLLQRAVELAPDDASLRSSLAGAHMSQVSVLGPVGRGEERLPAIERALELLLPIAAGPDAEIIDHGRLAEALLMRVEYAQDDDSWTWRLDRLAECEAELDVVREVKPRDSFVRYMSWHLESLRARALLSLQRFEEAAESCDRSRSWIEGLIAEAPDERIYREKLERVETTEAYVKARMGDRETGAEGLREEVERARALADAAPDDVGAQLNVAVALANLASLLKTADPPGGAALDEVEEAVAEGLYIVDEYEPARPGEHVGNLRRALVHGRTIARARAGELEAAVEDAEMFAELSDHDVPKHLVYLSDVRAEIAIAMDAAGAPDEEVRTWWEATLQDLERAVDLGLEDRDLLTENEAYAPLHDEERFRALLGRL